MDSEFSDTQSQDKEIVAGFNLGSKGLQIKQLKITVEKMNIQAALEKELQEGVDMDSSFELCGNIEALQIDTNTKSVTPTPPELIEATEKESSNSKIITPIPNMINFKPSLSSTPIPIVEREEADDPCQTPTLKGDKNIKCQQMVLGKKNSPQKDENNLNVKVDTNSETSKIDANETKPVPVVEKKEADPYQTPTLKGGKNVKCQKVVLGKKNNPQKDENNINVKVDTNSEASKIDANEKKSVEKPEVLPVVVKTKVQESGNPLATNEVCEKEESVSNVKKISDKMFIVEGKTRLIQVKSPRSVRHVVVLNSVKTAMNKEMLVKVIDPIDPPREEDRLSVAKICANAKKEAAQKKKLEKQKKKNGETEDLNDAELLENKEKQEVDVAQNKGTAQKMRGKIEMKSSKVETQKREVLAPKIVDLEMKLEDGVQAKKREAQRKREEIQRKREELLRKREAIKLRKEQQRQESLQMKKEENNEQIEQENRVEKIIPKNKGSATVVKNQTTDVLKRNNSQELQAKREVKVIVQSSKGQGAQKTESGEALPKNKGQGVQKTESVEVLPKNKGQGTHKTESVELLPKNKGQGSHKTETVEVLPKNKGQGVHKTESVEGLPKNKGQGAHKTESVEVLPKNKGQGAHKTESVELLPKNKGQGAHKTESVELLPKNKGQGVNKTESGELLPKNKGQTPTPKIPLAEVSPKGKVQVAVTKTRVTKKNAKKEVGVIAARRTSNIKKAVEVKPITLPVESPVRRSGRAIKKKTFGDEMLTFDIKEDITPEVDDPVSDEDFGSEVDEDDDSIEDYDDPDRLWCICQKPHNNRFMICCDRCEDWFHGTCVGITKAIGQQMEDEGQEWVCPKCKKAEKAMRGIATYSKKVESTPVVTSPQVLPVVQRTNVETKSNATIDTKSTATIETKAEPKKNVINSDSKKEIQLSQPVSEKISVTGKKIEVSLGSPKSHGKTVNEEKTSQVQVLEELPSSSSSSSAAAVSSSSSSTTVLAAEASTSSASTSSAAAEASSSKDTVNETKCVLESCNRPPKADSVYCSNECVLKHAQMSLKLLGKTDKDWEEHQIAGASAATFKSEPRVLVYEKSTGKILSGSEAPSLREVKTWLKDHPEYAVLQPGMMRTSGAVVKTVKTDVDVPGSDTLGQKKVIQLSTQSSASITATPPKLTVVKSVDGRIMIKTSEALSKGIVNKIVSTGTTTMPTVTKSVIVNSLKPSVASAKAIVKEAETKVSESDASTKNLEPTSVKTIEPVSVRKNVESSPVKKNIDTITVKKFAECSPIKKNIESSPIKKNIESSPIKKNVESSPVKKNIEIVSPNIPESPTKNIEAPTFKNIDSVNLKNLESPTKLPDTTTAKVTSPIKDPKKNPIKPAVVEKKAADPNIVRNNVKKTLTECLLKRSKEFTKEFEYVTEEDISELAEEIEKELFLFFGKDVGFKYKSRYRSLLFNIRDTKNNGLFRKILNGTISPSNLAKMTSEELASKELAEWRKIEEKKELQAIEKYELDMISLGNTYIMKSHKGEIEIDKDEFIKDKEKAPETINSLPADPMMTILEDTTSSHKTHMYDLNCKICTRQEELSTVPQDMKNKGKHQEKKDLKEDKISDPLKVKDKKERKSSSDRDRKERHRHKSKDDKDRDKKHKRERSKEIDKDKDDAKIKNKEGDKERKASDKEKDKYKDKHRSRKDSERERHKSEEKKERRDSKEERERKHKHKKDRRDSKDDRDRRRRDSDREDRKRKHSESRSDDRKRRDSEKSRHRELDIIIEREMEALDKLEHEKAVVSTSEDVVVDLHRSRRESFSYLDAEAKDAVPTSTVIGSPEIIELKDDENTPYGNYESRALGSPPLLFHVSPRRPPLPMDYPQYIPPLPGDEAPLPPPLPDSPPTPPLTDIPATPPFLDSPVTPPLPDSMLDSPKTPSLPEEICLSPSIADDDDFPATPPLPDDDDDDLDDDDDDDDIPATPPLPCEIDSTLMFKDKSSTPPLPFSKLSLPSSQPSSSTVDLDRLTPPLENVHSTVEISSPVPVKSAEPVIVWKGAIHMTEVSKFNASAFEVSGKARFLPEDVPKVVEVVGRISPDMVWSYIAQTKKTGNKEILVVRFQPSNEEEKVSYIALYSYLSSKKRYGVIGNCEKAVKDFYVVPLASHQPIPQVLLPLDGPGFEEHRAHMLIGVIIRAKHRRIYDHITCTWQIVGGSTNNTASTPVHRTPEVPERSYTPPLPTDQDIEEIALVATDSSEDDSKFKERSTTPPIIIMDNDGGDSPEFLHPSLLKRQGRSQSDCDQPKKRVSLDLRGAQDVAEVTLLRKEPKSPKESSFTEGSLDQESMLAELNRQIEVHKKELSEMQKTVLNEEEEPYSPSRPNTASPGGGDEPLKLDTSKINIPSNLQEILNNIKEKEVEIKNKEQEIKRRLNLSTDLIVMNYGKFQNPETKNIDDKTVTSSDVDFRQVLHSTPKEMEHRKDVDLRVLQGRDVKENVINSEIFGKTDDTDLRVRDPRLARAHAAAVMEAIEKGKTLRKLSDEELLAKALEMEGKEKNSKHSQLNPDTDSVFQPVPPPPFMSAGPSGFIPQPGPMVTTNAMTCPQPAGMVGPPYMNQMGPPAQPVGMYGPHGGRTQGPQGPSSIGPSNVHEPPGTLGPHSIQDHNPMGPCGPSIHDGAGLPGCGPGALEGSQRFGESSRYQDDGGHWGDRNYSDSGRNWDYNYNSQFRNCDRYRENDHGRENDRYRDSDRHRGSDRYREGDHYRDRDNKDRNRDWRRRQDRDGGYQRYMYKRRNTGNRSGGGGSGGTNSGGGGSGDHERKRYHFDDGKPRKKNMYRDKKKKWGGKYGMSRKNKDFKDNRESNRGPQDNEEDDDDCPYEIDY